MTMRWDKGNIPRGEKRLHLVGLNDVFATLCDLAGVDIPAGQAVDSVSRFSQQYIIRTAWAYYFMIVLVW